jgi:putative ABC transport system permease protein
VKFLGLILRNAWRSKVRTLLTVVSTGVALFLFCLLRTIVTSLDASVEVADASRLVVRRSISLIFPLPIAYRDRLQQLDGVTGVTWANWFGGRYPADERGFFAQFGVDPDTYFELYPELVLEPEELQAFKRERTACIVGSKLAKKYGWKLGQDVTLAGDIYPGDWKFTIRGIYEPRTPDVDATTMYFQWKYLDESQEAGNRGQVGIYILKLADPNRAAATAEAVDAMFANSAAETRTETEKAFQLGFITMMGNIRGAVRIVSIFVLAGFFLVAVNTMMMAARERTREIAVLKTLGFPDDLVLRLVMVESTAISLLGGLLGIAAATGLFRISALSGGVFANFAVKPATMLIGLAIALVMGALSGVVPALAAARLRVVEALRQA